MTTDATHDPALTSWVESANGHPDWPIQNLPLGVFRVGDKAPRIATAIGDMILDLYALAKAGLIEDEDLADACRGKTLNALFAQGDEAMMALA